MGRAYEVRKASMAKTSAAKAKVYSRYGKEIYIAAKNGVADIEMNTSLKRVVEKARANQVPADVIKRAIDKAKGGSTDNFEEIRYEGYGPGGSTIIVDCLTDNVNRTYSEVRNCFNKSKSKIGVSGSVSFLYDHLGILSFKYNDEEAILEQLLNSEVEVTDIENEDGEITVYVEPTDLYKAKEAIDELITDVNYEALEITMLPKDYTEISGDEDIANFEKLMNMLEEQDDVQNIYHNVKQ